MAKRQVWLIQTEVAGEFQEKIGSIRYERVGGTETVSILGVKSTGSECPLGTSGLNPQAWRRLHRAPSPWDNDGILPKKITVLVKNP